MRKGLIALALFGVLFVALMFLAPRPRGGDDPPGWTRALGWVLGGWAPRVRDLGGEYYRFDEAARTLTGEHSGEQYALGQRLELRLVEANPVSGALRFELPEGKGAGASAEPERRDRRAPRVLKRRGRPGNIRHQGGRR